MNFVADLTCIESLADNYNLTQLFLTGNPVTQYDGYRYFVIATLPQLKELDGERITRSEGIEANQNYDKARASVIAGYEAYMKEQAEREREEAHTAASSSSSGSSEGNGKVIEQGSKEYWDEEGAYTPASRKEMSRAMQAAREDTTVSRKEELERVARGDHISGPARPRMVDGKILQCNEGGWKFRLDEDDSNGQLTLDFACYRFLDTSLIDVDLQPTYVRITVKSKVFQLAFPKEIRPLKSKAKRSATTGHLVLNMPYATSVVRVPPHNNSTSSSKAHLQADYAAAVPEGAAGDDEASKVEKQVQFLEVGGKTMMAKKDLANIVSGPVQP